jgi:hypothetical protein
VILQTLFVVAVEDRPSYILLGRRIALLSACDLRNLRAFSVSRNDRVLEGIRLLLPCRRANSPVAR